MTCSNPNAILNEWHGLLTAPSSTQNVATQSTDLKERIMNEPNANRASSINAWTSLSSGLNL